MSQMAAQRGGSQTEGVYPPDHSRVPAHHAPALSKMPFVSSYPSKEECEGKGGSGAIFGSCTE